MPVFLTISERTSLIEIAVDLYDLQRTNLNAVDYVLEAVKKLEAYVLSRPVTSARASEADAPAEVKTSEKEKPKEKISAEKPEKAVEAVKETVGDSKTEADLQAATFDKVKKAILEVSRSKGRDAAKQILAEFGAEKIGPEIKPEDYVAIIKKAEDKLKEV